MKVSLIGLITIIVLVGCGGGNSSKETKEPLSKSLEWIGLSQAKLVNICQDSNNNGICETEEKISFINDSNYLLKTNNPELPILAEIQDIEKIDYDNGKFTLEFDGFKTTEDDDEVKEISILESMVDTDILTKIEADKFRTLNNQEAQDKYYLMLLDILESNINIFRANEFSSQTAITTTIKKMAKKTKVNQQIANSINACGDEQDCIDEEIKKFEDKLVILEEKVFEIKERGDNIKWIKPSLSTCKNNGGVYDKNNNCSANKKDAEIICNSSGGVLPNIETWKKLTINCGGELAIITEDSLEEYLRKTRENSNNASYKSCYKDIGISSSAYWSSSTWIMHFYYGQILEMSFSSKAKGSVFCVAR